MPIDPSILHKYDPPKPTPPPPTDGKWPLLLAAAGTPALLLYGVVADGRPALIQLLVLLTTLAWIVACLALWYIGYQKDGLLGALFERENPLGTVLTGDDSPSWMRFAVGWLLVLAAIVCGVLLSRTPGAIPQNWLHTGRAVRATTP